MQSTVNQENRIKDLWEENMRLAKENVELTAQVKDLEVLNTGFLKSTVMQTDKVSALKERVNNLNAQIRLLIAIIREGGDLDEQETEKGTGKTAGDIC